MEYIHDIKEKKKDPLKKTRMIPILGSNQNDNIYHGIQPLSWPDSCLTFPDSSFVICCFTLHTTTLNDVLCPTHISLCLISLCLFILPPLSGILISPSSTFSLVLFKHMVQVSAQTSQISSSITTHLFQAIFYSILPGIFIAVQTTFY